VRRGASPAVVVLAALAAACIPSLGPGDSLVTSTRILAVRADPAEAAPGTRVTFGALVAAPSGAVAGPDIAWSFCTAPKPLTEDNVVSDACLGASALVTAGAGAIVSAATPRAGCSLFGPDTASPGFRPRDPDGTGGYYQPLRLDLQGADSAFALVRIHCDLPNASADEASAFAAAYKMNENPQLLPLAATVAGAATPLTRIPAGARVGLRATWAASSAETFAYFDPSTQEVTQQRESMQVAWYANAGSFDGESTGRASTDMATTTDNVWTAPSRAGAYSFWIVLRDSRGGVDWAQVDVTVVP
jgi:hypothetical protein